MATQEYAASIQGVAIRVTRLDASGNLLNGPGDSYTTSAFMRVSFTPEYEEGDEITEKSANGTICVSYKAPDTLKRITMELAICEPDPELSALISGGLLLRKNVNGVVKSVGWAAPGVGDDPAGNGVAIEAWSHAVKDGKRAANLPYFHWVFPYAKLRQSGDRVIENGMMANTFEGYGLGNPQFAAGLDGRWEFPVASERPYSYARTSWAPTGLQGFYTWTDYKSGNTSDQVFFTKAGIQSASAINISGIKAQNTTAVVTLSNTLANAGIVAGDTIIATNLGDTFNTGSVGSDVISLANLGAATTTINTSAVTVTSTAGLIAGLPIVSANASNITDHTVVSVTNATSYVASVNALASANNTNLSVVNAFAYTLPVDAGTTVITGTINAGSRITLADSGTEAPNYTAVTTSDFDSEYAGGNGIGTYNVPGGLNYNSDNDIDFIIKSNED